MTAAEIRIADERAASEDFAQRMARAGLQGLNLDHLSLDPTDYAALERLLDRLSLYCESKRRSMQLRLAGDIEATRAYERNMERHYQQLPPWARW